MTTRAMATTNNSLAPRWKGMDLELLGRMRRSASIFGAILAIPFATYFGIGAGLAWASGIAWSLINLYFITALTREVITTDERRVRRIVWILALKFPALYGAGYLLLGVAGLPVIWLVAGFTWPFFVLTLKGLGRAWLSLDEAEGNSPS